MYNKVGDPLYDAQCIQIRWGEEGVGEAFIYTYYPSGAITVDLDKVRTIEI